MKERNTTKSLEETPDFAPSGEERATVSHVRDIADAMARRLAAESGRAPLTRRLRCGFTAERIAISYVVRPDTSLEDVVSAFASLGTALGIPGES